jgi:hypothetical protein
MRKSRNLSVHSSSKCYRIVLVMMPDAATFAKYTYRKAGIQVKGTAPDLSPREKLWDLLGNKKLPGNLDGAII